jgi:tetratricopeptide (TPR) repeat protein
MRYVCLHCGNRFELEEDDAKKRCPSCLRVTGLEKLDGSHAAGGARARWLVPGAIAAVLAALLGGYAVWRSSTPREVGAEVPRTPLERDVLIGHLRRLRVDARPVLDLLAPDEAVERLAEEATEGRRSALDKADAVYQWIRQRARQNAFVRWSLGIPRETPVGVARVVRTWIREDGARRRLYPLEAAALMVAALRAVDVPAMIAEAWEFPGDRAPPDPSGHFGYYLAAVYEGDAGEGEPRLYDPWGGHDVQPPPGRYRVLDDVQALGAALSLRALHLLVRESDPARALEVSADALRMDPRSPVARSVRGAILLASGGLAEGIREFEAASQIRADAPRRQLLADVFLAQGDLAAARRELTAALEASPDHANAHASLAALHLHEADPDLAREELEIAQRLDPDLHTLPGLWAGYWASIGEFDRAVESARQAVERNPWHVQQRLLAARVYRQAGRYDEMRREARAVLERTPAGQRGDMERLIRQLLGPTALESPLGDDEEDEDDLAGDEEDEPGDGDDETAAGGSGPFRLGEGSRLLGRAGGARPRLLEGPAESLAPGGADGRLLLLGDPPALRLGAGPDQRLTLEPEGE